MANYKEMTIKEIIRINILLEKEVVKTLREALTYVGPEDVIARRIADVTIQSFSENFNQGKAELNMGASHVPYEKQFSLRILRKHITSDDVVRAIIRISKAERVEKLGCSEDEIPESMLNDDEIRRLYHYIEPMFIVIGVLQISEDSVILASKRLFKRGY